MLISNFKFKGRILFKTVTRRCATYQPSSGVVKWQFNLMAKMVSMAEVYLKSGSVFYQRSSLMKILVYS